jgi:hypothetical protein
MKLRWRPAGMATIGNAYGPIYLYRAKLADGRVITKHKELSSLRSDFRVTGYHCDGVRYRRLKDVPAGA